MISSDDNDDDDDDYSVTIISMMRMMIKYNSLDLKSKRAYKIDITSKPFQFNNV